MREAIRQIVLRPHQLRHAVTDPRNQHDPSPRLSAFITVRDARGTTWTSPAGQTAHTPHFHHPPPQPGAHPLPDPHQLAQHDLTLTRARFQPGSGESDRDQPPAATPADRHEEAPPPTGATRHGWPDEPAF